MNSWRLRGKTPAHMFRSFCFETSLYRGKMAGGLYSVRDSVSPARLDPLDKHQALSFGQRPHGLEPVGFERFQRVA